MRRAKSQAAKPAIAGASIALRWVWDRSAAERLGAQGAAPGAIEGRVFDAGRGEYLELARVSVEGTAIETLTDNPLPASYEVRLLSGGGKGEAVLAIDELKDANGFVDALRQEVECNYDRKRFSCPPYVITIVYPYFINTGLFEGFEPRLRFLLPTL